MVDSGAYIRDVHFLEQLDDKIKCSREKMANIEQGVSNYINGVRETLERQLSYIQQRLGEAESNLSNAESALASCQASQTCNELGVIVPSCSIEESEVATARIEVDKWRTRYERGRQILEECQQEISGYHSGGQALIKNMCENQAPEASRKLSLCFESLQDILNTNMVSTINTDVLNQTTTKD